MKRDLYAELLAWKKSALRKPLILKGARQVGKTFLLQQFAKQEYENAIYLNFDEKPDLCSFFQSDLDPHRIISTLQIHFEENIEPEKTLIFLDEIQECPEALNSLKYFQEKATDYHVVSAGSLLGIKLANRKGFPVGKVDFLELFPLSFLEFLTALRKNRLRELLETKTDWEPLLEPFHKELVDLLKRYFVVGGMPEAVAYFAKNQDNLLHLRKIQNAILDAYLLDFAKHAPENQVMKITTLWKSVPTQLAKENKKFTFAELDKSARAREYEEAFQWLEDASLIHRAYRITAPKVPLEGDNVFKVYLLDVGLLSAMSHLPPKVIVEGDQLFMEFKGALTENFVAEALVPSFHKRLFYWASPGSAEVDFILPIDSDNIPLEVKSGVNRRTKSLHVYGEKYRPKRLLRTSPGNFHANGNYRDLPLYALSNRLSLEMI